MQNLHIIGLYMYAAKGGYTTGTLGEIIFELVFDIEYAAHRCGWAAIGMFCGVKFQKCGTDNDIS